MRKWLKSAAKKSTAWPPTYPCRKCCATRPKQTLLIGWGGTFGHLYTAAEELNREGIHVALAQFRYINPLPANTAELLSRYKRIIVAELNTGQFADYLQARFPKADIRRINKVEGQPFLVAEIINGVKSHLS